MGEGGGGDGGRCLATLTVTRRGGKGGGAGARLCGGRAGDACATDSGHGTQEAGVYGWRPPWDISGDIKHL